MGTDSSASVVQRRTEGKADELYPMMPQRLQVAFSLTILEFLHSLAHMQLLYEIFMNDINYLIYTPLSFISIIYLIF
jgi:hypothetical protein